jgi:hypothetical protein
MMRQKVREMRGGSVKERVEEMSGAMLEVARACIPMKKASRYNRPYWDDELTEMRKEWNRARNRVGEDVEGWKEKNKALQERVREKKEEYWRQYVEGLTESEEMGKVWKTIKCLTRGDKGEAPNEVLVTGGREARTEKEKAGSFVEMYAEVSKVKLGKEERKRRVEVGRRLAGYREGDEEFGVDFTMGEMVRALGQMKEKKKGGVDGVEAAMVKRLPREALEVWLHTFNMCWWEGTCPGAWKKAQIIPLLKAGKDAKDRASYRPVSLTPVCAKWLERMVVNRLYHWLEREGVVNPWQAGFQCGRSTGGSMWRG